MTLWEFDRAKPLPFLPKDEIAIVPLSLRICPNKECSNIFYVRIPRFQHSHEEKLIFCPACGTTLMIKHFSKKKDW